MTRKDHKPDHGDAARRHISPVAESRWAASTWGETRFPRSENRSLQAPPPNADTDGIARWWRDRLEHVLGVRSTHVRVDVDCDTVYLSGHLPRALALALRGAIDASDQGDRVHNLVETELWSN
jgi:hypothetical protein